MGALTTEQTEAFLKEGYLIFESLLDPEECAAVKADIDALEAARRSGGPAPWPVEYPHLGGLVSDPRVMGLVEAVMGQGFAFHHLHAVRQDAGAPGVNWHQDYEQSPQSNRSHTMVHLFYYFNGLNGEIGDLLVLPRTQKTIVDNGALWHLGTADLPGTLVVDSLPPGSAVLVNSALWHARRPKPGGEEKPRYFADASYCQAGIRWPAYGNKRWQEMLACARAAGLERDGLYAHLFDETHFFDDLKARAMLQGVQGSLILDTKEWKE
jgi:hypothetical protein